MASLLDVTPFGAIADVVGKVIDRVVPDKAANDAAKNALAAATQSGELQAMLGQIEINKIEAANPNWFISGWRPAAGWVSVIALALVYWPKAIVMTAIWTWQAYTIIHTTTDPLKLVLPNFPDLGVTDLLGLLGSMLGFGVMRTFEKHQDCEANR